MPSALPRKRCWKYDWVLEFDIGGLSDNIDHELLLRTVRRHVTCKWALLYLERWLTVPMDKDGIIIEQTRGTPQGGVISPIIQPFPALAECGLEMHPTKTKIVYCKDSRRKDRYSNVKFDFLGYCFRPRLTKNLQDASVFCSFLPGVSASALKPMRAAIRDLNLRRRTHVSMADIARQLNPLLRGWIEYCGRFTRAVLGPILRYVNQTIEAWMMQKFKRFMGRKAKAGRVLVLERLSRERPGLFAHWKIGIRGSFASWEPSERPAVRFHRPTRQNRPYGSEGESRMA